MSPFIRPSKNAVDISARLDTTVENMHCGEYALDVFESQFKIPLPDFLLL